MVSLILPKNQQNSLRIQDTVLSEFCSFFGRIQEFIIYFRDFLTFRTKNCTKFRCFLEDGRTWCFVSIFTDLYTHIFNHPPDVWTLLRSKASSLILFSYLFIWSYIFAAPAMFFRCLKAFKASHF